MQAAVPVPVPPTGRNIALKVLRGIEAHRPALGDGEFYFSTDSLNLYIGNAGNVYYIKAKKV